MIHTTVYWILIYYFIRRQREPAVAVMEIGGRERYIIIIKRVYACYYHHIGSFIDAIITIKTIMKENWLVIKNNDRSSRSPRTIIICIITPLPLWWARTADRREDAGSETFRLIINVQTIPCVSPSRCVSPQRVHFFNPKVNESNLMCSILYIVVYVCALWRIEELPTIRTTDDGILHYIIL